MNPAFSNDGALHLQIEQQSPMPLIGELSCPPGQLLALVGPSGAGKTSLLRCMAGLMRPATGHVRVGHQVWDDTQHGIHLSPQKRRVGLVFQHYALMPHLSAQHNVALALLHLPQTQRLSQAAQWLQHVKLSVDQQARKPSELSGGQQQRVAVARALARSPQLLLLDEPFSAVDQMSRQGLYDLLAELRETLHIPMVLVTHDLVEARHLADQLAVMDAGHIVQTGSPEHIYRSPRNARVADLMGIQNRFQGLWLGPQSSEDSRHSLASMQWLGHDGQDTPIQLRVRDKGRIQVGQRVTWVIQGDGLHLPHEQTQLPHGHGAAHLTIPCTVSASRHLGETTLAELSLLAQPQIKLRLSRSGPQRQALESGHSLNLTMDCDWVHVMPTRNIE